LERALEKTKHSYSVNFFAGSTAGA